MKKGTVTRSVLGPVIGNHGRTFVIISNISNWARSLLRDVVRRTIVGISGYGSVGVHKSRHGLGGQDQSSRLSHHRHIHISVTLLLLNLLRVNCTRIHSNFYSNILATSYYASSILKIIMQFITSNCTMLKSRDAPTF